MSGRILVFVLLIVGFYQFNLEEERKKANSEYKSLIVHLQHNLDNHFSEAIEINPGLTDT